MARKLTGPALLPSVLDRLIDHEPQNRLEATRARTQSLEELHESVRRDLEWLLNTRRPPLPSVSLGKQLARSVYSFGLPDTTGLPTTSNEDRTRLARLMESAIAQFEPRLANVSVTTPAAPHGRLLHFQIAALLRAEPAPARIYFDTTLELTSGEYAIQGNSRA